MPKRVTYIFLLLIICTKGLSQQPKLMLPVGHSKRVVSTRFSPDGKLALTVSTDGTAKLWEAGLGILLKDFKSGGDASISFITDAWFSPAGKKVIIKYEWNDKRIYHIASGEITEQIINLDKKDFAYLDNAGLSPDNKRLLMISAGEGRLWVLDIETMKPVFAISTPGSTITSYSYSNDGKKILTYSSDNSIRTWDALTGRSSTLSKKLNTIVDKISFSWDDKRILAANYDSLLTLDAISGKLLRRVKIADDEAALAYSATNKLIPGGKLCIKLYGYQDYYNDTIQVQYWDSLAVCDRNSGKTIYTVDNIIIPASSDFICPDGSKFLILKNDSSAYMINAATGKELFAIPAGKEPINSLGFNSDGKKFITTSNASAIRIWDAQSGQLIKKLDGQSSVVYDARFSYDNKKIIAGYEDTKARIWDLSSEKPVVELKGRLATLAGAKFDSSGKKIFIATYGKRFVFDIGNSSFSAYDTSGKLSVDNFPMSEEEWQMFWFAEPRAENTDLIGDSLIFVWIADIIGLENVKTNTSYNFWTEEKEINNFVCLSPDNKKILATSANNTIKLYDIEKSKPILRFAIIDNTDYLVVDSSNRYDGTEAARRLLYFTCGNEIVGLDQVKDQLWVPDLAQRTNNKEVVNAKTIDELSICGLTPLLERGGSATEYHFKIKPRRGGIGKTVIAVNGIEFSSYSLTELKKTGTDFEIRIPKDQLKAFFAENQENVITVRTQTADDATSSRTLSIIEDPDKEKRAPPNLFGVMVGVSNYKGESMDLDYAAIDAKDISSTISDAAKKLLGNEHVFMYNLTTDSGYVFPEKKTIKRTFDDIAVKAGPNDILFIFLSGHGVMQDKTKQFYYMTADASSLVDESIFKDVGISMTELADWIKPQNIKAQKRILILDACKSGQAINDIITPDQRFLAVKGDDNAQQVKAIDKLNEKSGLFILSASASSQLAFESGIYEHGYLTYSLLKAIKEKPDILEDGKYLNVSRWFNTAAQTVSELAKQDRARQEPQIVTNTDFNVGLVDNEVIAKINLWETKTLFASGNFINSDIGDDDLDLRKLIDKQLGILSGTGSAKIYFLPSANSAEAFSFTGSYSVKENSVIVKVNLKKDRTIKYPFELTGTKDKLNELVDAIILKAMDWIDANK